MFEELGDKALLEGLREVKRRYAGKVDVSEVKAGYDRPHLGECRRDVKCEVMTKARLKFCRFWWLFGPP